MTDTDSSRIGSAKQNKGALSRKAKSMGESTTMSFAKKDESSPGKLGKRSRLSETLSKLRRKGAA